MLAMGKYDLLKNIWESITSRDVYSGKINWFALVKIIFGAKSVLGNKPLYELIKKYVSLKDLKMELILILRKS